MRQMLFEIMVAIFRCKHARRPDPEIFEVIVLVTNNSPDAPRFRVRFQNPHYVCKADTIQFAVFKRLDIILAFLLREQAFKQYDHIILFHKPGSHFAILVIITSYQSFFQVPCTAAYLTFTNQQFIFLFLVNRNSLLSAASRPPEIGCNRFKKGRTFSTGIYFDESRNKKPEKLPYNYPVLWRMAKAPPHQRHIKSMDRVWIIVKTLCPAI